jgi:hypothetical protein
MRRVVACRRIVLGWVLGAVTLCVPCGARAQARWGLGRWQAKGTFFLDWEKQDDKNTRTRYETILFQERLALRNVGVFIIDPRLVTLDLGGSFGLVQEERMSPSESPLRVGNGTLHDYALDGSFLSDKPYPFTLFASRNQTTLAQGFGGQSDVTFASRGGILELREGNGLEKYGWLNFRSVLDVRQELLSEDSAVFGSPFRRDETRNIVRYRGHKGGENSDLDLSYEFNDVRDPLNPSNVFDSHTARLLHSLDFGPTLNRRLDSSLYYFTRTESAPGSYVSVDEGLHIDHHRDFATDYRYGFSRSDSTAGVVTTNTANVGLVHWLYRRLLTTLDARGMHQDLPTGGQTNGGARGTLGYRRSLPWNGEVFLHTSAGHQVDDNDFTASTVDVVDERHVAPPVFGAGAGFLLDNDFVQNDTIVVVDVRGGSRLTATLNVDYVVSPEGPSTKIIPLVGSPVIQPGDPLEVSYTYNVDPGVRYATTSLGASVGVEFPWVAASYEHALSDQTRLAGTATPGFLIDQNLDRFRLELRGQWNGVWAQSAVAYEVLRSTIIDSNAWRFGQLLAYEPRPDIVAQISSDQSLVDYPGQERRSDAYFVRGTVDWFGPPGLSVATFAGYRFFHDTSVPSDELVDAGVRLRWSYRNLEISPSFTWADYRGRLTDMRGEVRITRSWF